jgi:hypothetical protein
MSDAAEIIYLHIPKTAGTSQQRMFRDIYGKDRVYWRGGANSVAMEDAAVVGGHRHLRHYKNRPGVLYASILREPVSRVVSFFNWVSDPGYGKERVHPDRLTMRDQWVKDGLDPDSLQNTLVQCKKFRDATLNTQCRYLTRHGPSFKGVTSTFANHSWVIGTQDRTDDFTRFFSELLGVTVEQTYEINRDSSASSSPVLDTETRGLINELVQEDEKLYRYITEEWSGLYHQLCRAMAIPAQKRIRPITGMPLGNRIRVWDKQRFSAWARLDIETDSASLPVQPGCANRIKLAVVNRSLQTLYPQLIPDVYVSFHIYNKLGECISFDGNRRLLLNPIPARSSVPLNFNVCIPRKLYADADHIQLSMLWKNKFWLDTLSNHHSAQVKLDKV